MLSLVFLLSTKRGNIYLKRQMKFIKDSNSKPPTLIPCDGWSGPSLQKLAQRVKLSLILINQPPTPSTIDVGQPQQLV